MNRIETALGIALFVLMLAVLLGGCAALEHTLVEAKDHPGFGRAARVAPDWVRDASPGGHHFR